MTHKLARALVLALATGAVAAPAASAMHEAQDMPGATGPAAPQAVVVRVVHAGGFDYGDAAIGAGLAAVGLLGTAAGTLAVRRSRHPRFSQGARA